MKNNIPFENIQTREFEQSFYSFCTFVSLVNDKKIVVDEAISGWIKDKISKPKDTELQAYYGACDNSYGGSFSTIDDSENKPFISSFTFLGDEQKIETPNGENVGSSNNSMDGKQNSLSNSYDKMQQNRTNEFNLPQRR